MLAFIVRRVIAGLIMVIVMSFVTFFLFFASPIDHARIACGRNCTEDQQKQTEKALGYDKNWAMQWGDFAKGVVVGRQYPADEELRKAAPQLVTDCPAPCLGYSRAQNKTVNEMMSSAIPISLSLAVLAFVMWMCGGILFGITAALRKGTFVDRGLVGLALIFYAFPTFFIGLFLYKYVAIKWQLVDNPVYVSIADGGIFGWLSGLLLPALTLALFYMAGYVRMTRAFVLESMTEDYVRTAKAKGLAPRKVLFKHTFRAALTPLVTMSGLDFAGLMGGAIITERVFNYQGLGRMAVNAAVVQDLPTLVGLVVLLASIVITANIVIDMLYAVIDPRVRLG